VINPDDTVLPYPSDEPREVVRRSPCTIELASWTFLVVVVEQCDEPPDSCLVIDIVALVPGSEDDDRTGVVNLGQKTCEMTILSLCQIMAFGATKIPRGREPDTFACVSSSP
jgi:hypothetical protein